MVFWPHWHSPNQFVSIVKQSHCFSWCHQSSLIIHRGRQIHLHEATLEPFQICIHVHPTGRDVIWQTSCFGFSDDWANYTLYHMVYAHGLLRLSLYARSGAPFTNIYQLWSKHGWVMISIIKCGVKSFFSISQNSTTRNLHDNDNERE